MRVAPLLVVAALMLAAPAAAEPITPVAFRNRLASAVSAAVRRPSVVIDDRSFRIKTVEGTELTVSIDNGYAAYLADPARLERILADFATTLTTPYDETDTAEQLVAIVRPSDYLMRSLPAGASLEHFVPPRGMAGDLSIFLAVDSPNAIRTASKGDLVRWKLDEEGAWKRGIANIKARIGPLSMIRLGDAEGASGLGAASGLAPSLLADPDFCSSSRPVGVDGQVYLVYGRDVMLFTAPTDAAMSRTFWRTVKTEVAAGQSMSTTPVTCRAGKWAVATPP